MIADLPSRDFSAGRGAVARRRPQGDGLMRAFAIYVAAGLALGFLAVGLLCLLGLIGLG